ncbi:hypothetical protein ACLD43_16080 [Clostridium botulinum]|uniref:hypothetical protein n=1 Tax=Clostridium botulinum TaxID=1491 RepID=UPI003A7F9AA8
MLERVKEDKVEEAKALLANNFEKQAEGKFTHNDITQFIPKIAMLLKPDKIEEVQIVMEQFAENFSN